LEGDGRGLFEGTASIEKVSKIMKASAKLIGLIVESEDVAMSGDNMRNHCRFSLWYFAGNFFRFILVANAMSFSACLSLVMT
jgi:hypothetical protein